MGNNDKREPQATAPASSTPNSTDRKDTRTSEQLNADKKAPGSERKDAAPASETPVKR